MMTDEEVQGSHQSVFPEMVAMGHIWLVACDFFCSLNPSDQEIMNGTHDPRKTCIEATGEVLRYMFSIK